MRAERIWPNGQRYTWTDAFGVVLLVSLYAELGKRRFLDEAEWVVSDVDRVLGRPRGIRIGEAPDRDGQYFHYLAMWLYARLNCWRGMLSNTNCRRSPGTGPRPRSTSFGEAPPPMFNRDSASVQDQICYGTT